MKTKVYAHAHTNKASVLILLHKRLSLPFLPIISPTPHGMIETAPFYIPAAVSLEKKAKQSGRNSTWNIHYRW